MVAWYSDHMEAVKEAVQTTVRTSELHRSAVATLAFFDLVSYPLTLTELHRLRFATAGASEQIALSELRTALCEGGVGASTRTPEPDLVLE